MVVQTGACSQRFAASVMEDFERFVSDFVDGLQAIRGKTRHGDEYLLHPLFGKLLQRSVRGRTQPAIAAELRLKRLRPFVALPAETANQGPRGSFHMRRVRVAFLR